jgi:hypothetical protein
MTSVLLNAFNIGGSLKKGKDIIRKVNSGQNAECM